MITATEKARAETNTVAIRRVTLCGCAILLAAERVSYKTRKHGEDGTSLKFGGGRSFYALATVVGVDDGRVASEGDGRGDGHERK